MQTLNPQTPVVLGRGQDREALRLDRMGWTERGTPVLKAAQSCPATLGTLGGCLRLGLRPQDPEGQGGLEVVNAWSLGVCKRRSWSPPSGEGRTRQSPGRSSGREGRGGRSRPAGRQGRGGRGARDQTGPSGAPTPLHSRPLAMRVTLGPGQAMAPAWARETCSPAPGKGTTAPSNSPSPSPLLISWVGPCAVGGGDSRMGWASPAPPSEDT